MLQLFYSHKATCLEFALKRLIVVRQCPEYTIVVRQCPEYTIVVRQCREYTIVVRQCPEYTIVVRQCPEYKIVVIWQAANLSSIRRYVPVENSDHSSNSKTLHSFGSCAVIIEVFGRLLLCRTARA